METPKTRAGYLTELIMAKIKENCAFASPVLELNISQYNRVYEAVLEILIDAGEPPHGKG